MTEVSVLSVVPLVIYQSFVSVYRFFWILRIILICLLNRSGFPEDTLANIFTRKSALIIYLFIHSIENTAISRAIHIHIFDLFTILFHFSMSTVVFICLLACEKTIVTNKWLFTKKKRGGQVGHNEECAIWHWHSSILCKLIRIVPFLRMQIWIILKLSDIQRDFW